MKKLIIQSLLVFMFFSCSNSNEKKSVLSVNGHCEMCKASIENSLKVEGVYEAVWDVETKELKISYDSALVSVKTISENIAEVGYESKLKK